MTLTILVSVSLLALVSSARPLPQLKLEDDSWKGLQVPGSGEDVNIQQVVQAVVKSHASLPEDLKEEDDVNVRLASSEEVQAYISSTDSDAIKALIHLGQDELHSPDEKELYDLLNRLEEERASGLGKSTTPVPDEVLDSTDADLVAKTSDPESRLAANSSTSAGDGEDDIDTTMNIPKDFSAPHSKSIIIMAVSCAIALLLVSCVAVVLYIAEILKKSIFRSTWNLLPQLEKNFLSHGKQDSAWEETQGSWFAVCDTNEGCTLEFEPGMKNMPIPGALISVKPSSTTNITLLRPLPPIPDSRATSSPDRNPDGSESGDEIDEKFFDAESPDLEVSPHGSTTPISAPTQVPPPPGLPALAAAAAMIAAVAVAHAPDMREVDATETTSVSNPNTGARPPWSVRAQEAGALVHAQDISEERRKYGRGVASAPGLDAALAMQLRPGFGIGADAAWLVRFVMALFGWCAVLMSGGGWRR
ncbi:hypothetical protein ACEPAI_2494 [Sanghuangporus weigelae]